MSFISIIHGDLTAPDKVSCSHVSSYTQISLKGMYIRIRNGNLLICKNETALPSTIERNLPCPIGKEGQYSTFEKPLEVNYDIVFSSLKLFYEFSYLFSNVHILAFLDKSVEPTLSREDYQLIYGRMTLHDA